MSSQMDISNHLKLYQNALVSQKSKETGEPTSIEAHLQLYRMDKPAHQKQSEPTSIEAHLSVYRQADQLRTPLHEPFQHPLQKRVSR